jgi:predicted aspartyl protease
MSCFYDKITIENCLDLDGVTLGVTKQEDVHKLAEVEALVDSGVWTLVINEERAKELGLSLVQKDVSEGAGAQEVEGWIAQPAVRVSCHGQKAIVEAFVVPGENMVILGALPMEIMDLWINPRQERLVPKRTLRRV